MFSRLAGYSNYSRSSSNLLLLLFWNDSKRGPGAVRVKEGKEREKKEEKKGEKKEQWGGERCCMLSGTAVFWDDTLVSHASPG